jgi:primosomal protein N' (replication factor Y)
VATVAVQGAGGNRSLYSYGIPASLTGALRPGHLVEVPFGTRTLQGVVLDVDFRVVEGFTLRDIHAVLEPEPSLGELQLDLAQWIAAYYACDVAEALAAMLPPGLTRATVVTYHASGQPTGAQRLTEMQAAILRDLVERGPRTMSRLSAFGDERTVTAALESLARRKLITRRQEMGRAASTPMELVVVLQPHATLHKLTGRQPEIVDYLQQVGGEAPLHALRDDLGIDRASIDRLHARRVVLTYPRQVRRDPLAHRSIERYEAPELTPQQQAAFSTIRTAMQRQQGAVFLLHGVTGSGKTEVYLRCTAEALAAGKQAIVLVPEIGLTPQTITRFAGRFPGQVALLHSRMSDGERFDEWLRIRAGECGVVVGARSALLSPVANPGLIVLDEEHDASYKQDRSPHYHAREVAIELARLSGATVVLGSATPDIVTYNRADRGELQLITMNRRVQRPGSEAPVREAAGSAPRRAAAQARPGDDTGLPLVQVVDMRLELKAGNRSIFSRALQREIEAALLRRQQVILFLNRRGNATFVNCRDCGYVVKCRRCDLPFTYHSEGERLQCHRCDAHAPVPSLCPSCGSWRIRYFGLGTQKVEQELRTRFPQARVQRYDRDVTTGKLAHETILDLFARGEADILVGTQIVTKGLDFPNVALVGAVAADTSLNLPDFRAAERTFSLLTQVAGRAGRAGTQGTVIVQSYMPHHFAIQAAAAHDYVTFYRDELRFRAEGQYPPYYQLARLTFSARSEAVCQREAQTLAEQLQTWTGQRPEEGIEVIGPAPTFTNKAADLYYWQILLRGADVHPILGEVPRGWSIDVDPVSLL